MKFGWVDFSHEEREKALGILHMLLEPGAVDELGIGVVRDAFADRFFPGTSTLLTRAKYFLLVPYILDEVIADGVRHGWTVDQTLRALDDEERKAGRRLWEKHRQDKELGIIGQSTLAHGGWVKRAPSELYWNGIRTLGICGESEFSLSQYVSAALSVRRARGVGLGTSLRGEENEGDDVDAGMLGGLKPFDFHGLNPRAWRSALNIALTPEESTYLRKKIQRNIPDSVFAIALNANIDLREFNGSFAKFAEVMSPLVDASSKRLLVLACRFMNLVYAARVRYNVILQGDRGDSAKELWAQIDRASLETDPGIMDEIFMTLKIPPVHDGLRKFLRDLVVAFSEDSCNAVDDLIRRREGAIKKERAKLLPRNAQKYSPDNWIGGYYLDFRLPDAARLVADIYAAEGVAHA